MFLIIVILLGFFVLNRLIEMYFVIPKNSPFYLFSTFSTFVLSVKLNCLLIVALLFIHGVRNFSMNQFLRFSCGEDLSKAITNYLEITYGFFFNQISFVILAENYSILIFPLGLPY